MICFFLPEKTAGEGPTVRILLKQKEPTVQQKQNKKQQQRRKQVAWGRLGQTMYNALAMICDSIGIRLLLWPTAHNWPGLAFRELGMLYYGREEGKYVNHLPSLLPWQWKMQCEIFFFKKCLEFNDSCQYGHVLVAGLTTSMIFLLEILISCPWCTAVKILG